MSTALRIVGQGLAGSLLAWRCERSALPFEIVDAGHARASSRVGAGIINPVTGQRIVKSWRVDELLPKAVQTYREIEAELAQPLLFPLRVRRFFRSERDRDVAHRKQANGDFAPYVNSVDQEGFWIESAYRLDTARLIEALRQRWIASGQLIEREITSELLRDEPLLTIWCAGAGELRSLRFAFAKLRPAKGEIIDIACGRLDAGVILNDGHWVLPLSNERAKVGATFQWDSEEHQSSEQARITLTESARRLIGPDFQVTGQDAGIRLTTPDKHPVVGRHPHERAHGILNGLGSKGALLAPWLAEQWVAHLTTGSDFDSSIDVARFIG